MLNGPVPAAKAFWQSHILGGTFVSNATVSACHSLDNCICACTDVPHNCIVFSKAPWLWSQNILFLRETKKGGGGGGGRELYNATSVETRMLSTTGLEYRSKTDQPGMICAFLFH